ncbi:MAG: hypothetical protein PVH61_13415 [Candidatus Aminicenantes bacterium]
MDKIMIKHEKIFILLCLLFCLVACSKKEKIVKDVGTFPWPPPKASAYCKIPSGFLLKTEGETYLKDVLDQLEKAMDQAGYQERELCAVKHGFAIASRIEQFQTDGTPEIANKRWEAKIKPLPLETLTTNFNAYLKAVFFTDVYHFRKIVFVVKPGEVNERKNPITPGEAKKWFSANVRSGRLKDILDIYYSRYYTCTALIYEFEKYKMNDEPIPAEMSNLTGKTHLVKSKLWHALENK